MSGTSMATPHVSGVTALLLETDSTLTTNEVKTALYDTASPVNKCYQCTRWRGSSCFRQKEVSCNPEITGAGVVNAYEAYLAVKPTGPECTVDPDCDDGLYCNGDETCQAGVCQAGTPVDCSSLSDQCNDGVCDEGLDQCIAEPKAEGTGCEDGLFCTVDDYCSSGSCVSGSQRTCNDNEECTVDSCDENNDVCNHEVITTCVSGDGCCPAGCDFTTDNDCPEEQPVQCWSGDYQYLYRNRNQLKKFCKCAQGTYGYKSYNYSWGRKTVYQYLDSGDNENWEVTSRSYYLPVDKVTCTDGGVYPTNEDYFWPK